MSKKPLRPVPDAPKEQPKTGFDVGDSFEVTDVEKGEIQLMERRLREVKIAVADHSLRIEQLSDGRRQLLTQVVERNKEYEEGLRRILKAHGVDLDAEDVGSWSFDVDTMSAKRTA